MDYDHEKVLADVVADVKADKSIMQPWKNKAMARIDEARVFIAEGKRLSPAKPPAGMEVPAGARVFPKPQPLGCICKPLEIDPACPVHGGV